MNQKQKHKDFPGNLIKIKLIEDEIEYAKSQLQQHNTGHIHTAIGWMEHRLNQLKGIEDDE
ncbi:MAG: hypothetical protein CMP33_03420 [Rickettsiales bacterium]|nr:hypothetical protein [Rickettsiales bacterium]|tara:strand:- start:36967 stop:37149 length:183 start_codon:yes stop_codon:yes gene_type:complete